MNDTAITMLRGLLGEDRVFSGKQAAAAYGAGLAARPATVEETCRLVQILGGLGIAMRPLGGGTSDGEDGPAAPDAAVIDTRDLNRIVEINEEDRYATVEAGCTWSALFQALKARGLRAPFFGLPSGAGATVGGTASANGAFFGSGIHGTMSDNVISLDVVLADGALAETGAAAAEGRAPFFRHFGPDLTGLFLGDCGAFGLKVRVTLPVIPLPAAAAHASFLYERFEDIAEAHGALAREGIAAEHWGLDPAANDFLAARGFAFLKGVTFTRDLPTHAGSAAESLANIRKMLVDGHRPALRGGYTLHATVEGESEKEAELKIGRLRRLLLPGALRELPGDVPKALRAAPFTGLADLLGNTKGRWLSVHGIFPLSKAATIAAVTDEYFVRHRDLVKRHGIAVSHVTRTAANGFIIETILAWPAGGGRARPDAGPLLRDLAGLWDAYGASHFGMARRHPYAESLSTASRAMAEAVKAALDPKGLMNPGALRLGAGAAARPRKPRFAEFPQNLLEDR